MIVYLIAPGAQAILAERARSKARRLPETSVWTTGARTGTAHPLANLRALELVPFAIRRAVGTVRAPSDQVRSGRLKPLLPLVEQGSAIASAVEPPLAIGCDGRQGGLRRWRRTGGWVARSARKVVTGIGLGVAFDRRGR